MNKFAIITDSASNLTDVELEKYEIEMISYSYIFNSELYNCYEKGRDYSEFGKYFYDLARKGEKIRTSLINQATWEDVFEAHMEQGEDVLFIGMSAGLTGTVPEAKKAADVINSRYKDNQVYVLDSIGASLGEGFLAVYASNMRKEGKTITEVISWIEANRLKMRHVFTVDNLVYLKNGGRISATTAFAGNLLAIKPILMATDKGTIALVEKIRGRKKSLEWIANDLASNIVDPQNQIIGIAHCDCPEDSKLLEGMIREKVGDCEILNVYYDTCSGTHVGPGAIAVFYFGSCRGC